ncbi:MAG: PAS domain-containing protein [Acidobacteria bacterium]|nr:PAS domain-containing protein [Acidobacteriota bacterium]
MAAARDPSSPPPAGVDPRALIDALPAVVFTADPTAPFVATFVSRAVEQLLGYTPAEVRGRTDWLPTVMDRDEAAQEVRRVRDWVSRGAPGTLTLPLPLRAQTRGGRWRWIDVRLRAVLSGDGTLAQLAGLLSDVTSYVEATELLRRVNEKVPAVLYQCRLRPDGTFEFPFVSDSAWRLYGLDPGVGNSDGAAVFDLVHPDDREGLMASTLESARTLAPWHGDFRVISPDGRVLWVAGHSTPTREADGSILWHGHVIDISDRKVAEAALASRDALLQEVATVNLEIARAGRVDAELGPQLARLGQATDVDRVYVFDVVRSDPGSTVIRQRVEWARPGVTPQIGNPGLQHFDLEAQGFTRWLDPLRAGQPVQSRIDSAPAGELAVLRDQDIQSLLVLPVIIDGTFAALVGFDDCRSRRQWSQSEIAILQLSASAVGELLDRERVREERARVEAARRAHQQHLEKLTAYVPGLIYQFRLRPDGSVGLPYASSGFEEVFGGAPDPGGDATRVFAAIHPDDVAMVRRTIAESAATLSLWTCAFRVRHPRKGLIWVEGRSAPETEADGSILWHGYATDITARVTAETGRIELERRLLHAQKLESLGVLAGGIAHDFNNLLLAVLGNLELAWLDLDAGAPARQGVQEAVAAARRAADLTRQMLAYSGRGAFVVQPTDLNALVEENVHLLRAVVPRTVSLDLALAPGLPPVVADPGQLQQVVMNLITNAAEALGGEPGHVVLSTGVNVFSAVELAASRLESGASPGPYVWFAVQDTGCGMTPDVLARLFDPFFSTKFTGRGLGMPAVQGIVTGHAGAILIDTAPGEGSTVKVLLPAGSGEPLAAADASKADATPASGASATILVVDDEAPVRRLLDLTLRRAGYRTLLARDGAEALQLFDVHRDAIDVILLDLTMPTMDGRAALEALRARSPGLKIILASGYSEHEVIRRFAGEGPTAFIQKPFQRDALLDAIARTLAR